MRLKDLKISLTVSLNKISICLEEKIMEILTSKKFWITALGMVCLTVCLISQAIDTQLFAGLFTALCGTYAIGQGIADATKKY